MNYPVTWQNDVLISCNEIKDVENVSGSEKTDKQLVELVLMGDENAFEQIFDRYKRLVASIAGSYFQRSEQIEEIIQISFAKVYSELKTYQGKHEFSLAGWLGRITRNACLDTLRNQKRKPENLFCEFSAERIETLFAVKGDKEKTADLLLAERDLAEKLLSYLQPEDRVILQMIYAEEMSIAQVAETTGSSIIKIKVRAHRARHALRKILKKFL